MRQTRLVGFACAIAAVASLSLVVSVLTVIAALSCVGLVTWFDEDTPLQLVAELKPQVLVKGGDYDMSKLAEAALVEGYGGKALAIPFVPGYSTTELVRRIRQQS